MTRRDLVQGALLVLGGEPLGALWRLVSGAREAIVRPGHASALEAPPPTGMLAEAEMETLVAFAEVLVEGRPLSPEERGYLVDHIRDRAQHGNLALYRTAIRLLDRLAGAPFSSLDLPRRIELMTRHRLTVTGVEPGEQFGAFEAEARALRTRAVPDLIDGYYRSPAGWAAVGYETFPGRCSDLAGYTRPPDSPERLVPFAG